MNNFEQRKLVVAELVKNNARVAQNMLVDLAGNNSRFLNARTSELLQTVVSALVELQQVVDEDNNG